MDTLLGEICRARARQKSAEAVVVKKAGESRKERRAKEPRNRPGGRTLENRRKKFPETVKERAKSTLPRQLREGRVKQWTCLKEPTEGKQARTGRDTAQRC